MQGRLGCAARLPRGCRRLAAASDSALAGSRVSTPSSRLPTRSRCPHSRHTPSTADEPVLAKALAGAAIDSSFALLSALYAAALNTSTALTASDLVAALHLLPSATSSAPLILIAAPVRGISRALCATADNAGHLPYRCAVWLCVRHACVPTWHTCLRHLLIRRYCTNADHKRRRGKSPRLNGEQ
jgi:hypothetical protein